GRPEHRRARDAGLAFQTICQRERRHRLQQRVRGATEQAWLLTRRDDDAVGFGHALESLERRATWIERGAQPSEPAAAVELTAHLLGVFLPRTRANGPRWVPLLGRGAFLRGTRQRRAAKRLGHEARGAHDFTSTTRH